MMPKDPASTAGGAPLGGGRSTEGSPGPCLPSPTWGPPTADPPSFCSTLVGAEDSEGCTDHMAADLTGLAAGCGLV